MAVCLIECNICCEKKQQKKTKFRSKANNYKSTQRKFMNKEGGAKATPKTKTFS